MKKKIFIAALAICLVVISIAGSSLAYFTDEEKYTNVFTAGNVDITLTVAGQNINETVPEPITDQNVYPGLTIEKNAVITNSGTEEAYVAAVITLKDKNPANNNKVTAIIDKDGSDENIPVALAKLLNGLASTGYKANVVDLENEGGYTIYLIKEDALPIADDATTTNVVENSTALFNSIVIPTSWDNAQMNAFVDLEITVVAYATQTKGTGFENAVSGIKTAFPEVFGNINF